MSQSNSTSSSNSTFQSNEERSPRFTRAIFFRILAVLAFIGLGTFAVIHSFGHNHDHEHSDDHTHADAADDNSSNDASESKPLFASADVDDGSSVQPATATDQPARGSFGAGTPARTNPAVAIQPIVTGRQTLPEAPGQFGNAAPQDRIAMRPNMPQAGALENSRNALQNATQRAGDIAGDLQRNASNAAGNALNGARQTATNVASGAQQAPGGTANGLRTSLGNTLNTNGQGLQATPGRNPLATSRGTARSSGSASQLKPPGGFRPDTTNPATPAANPFASPRPNTSQSAGSPDATSLNTSPFNSDPSSSSANSGSASRNPAPAGRPANGLAQDSRSTFGSATGLQSRGNSVRRDPPSLSGSTANMARPASQTQSQTQMPRAPEPRGFGSNTQMRPLQGTPDPSTSGIRPNTGTMNSGRSVPAMAASSSRPTGTTSAPLTTNATTLATPGDRVLEGAQAPSLTVEKIAPREVQLNQPADIQIVVRNTGRVTAQDVQVYDQIPQGAELLQAVPQPTRNRNGIAWQLGEIRPGQEKRIRLQLRPTQTGEIGSVAHVTFATQASMRTIVTKPVLNIFHSAKPRVMIGDTVVLDITVENKGDGAARNVLIQENIPPQLAFTDGYREGLEYEIGTLAPGQSKRLQLTLKAANMGRLRNVLTATGEGGITAQHAIDMEVVAPALMAVGSGPKRRYINREATHQFSVENKGTAAATNVELIAKLPTGLRYVNANNRGRYDANTHAVYWSLAELAENVIANVEITTIPTAPGNQQIDFEAFADLGRKTSANQVVSVDHLVDIYFEIDDVVDLIEIGSDTSYKIEMVNQGTIAASEVKLQVDFPAGIQPTDVESNLPNQIQGNRVIFSPIASMNPGEKMSLIINARGIQPGDHRVAAHIQTSGRETPVTKEETTRVYNDR